MKRYLICYDIAHPRRLVKVHKTCREYGIPLQYSVFLAELNRNGLERLIAELRDRITSEDDIRIYPLQNRADGLHMGQTRMPEGLVLGVEPGWSAILWGDGIVGDNDQDGQNERDSSGSDGNLS